MVVAAKTGHALSEAQRDKYLSQYGTLLPKWLATTRASGMWAEQGAELAKVAAGGANAKSVFQLPDLLASIAVEKLADGVVDVLNGQLGGWNKIAGYARYQLAWLRSGLAASRLNGQPDRDGPWSLTPYHRFVQGAFAGLITGDRAFWQPLLELTLLLDRNGSARASSHDPAFPEFARALARAWLEGHAPEQPVRADDPFARLLSTWSDPVANAQAFASALDYHLWRSDDRTSARNPDDRYSHPGILLFPSHLVAYLSLRKQLGMVTVDIAHPMMELPTFQPPEGVKPADDPVLDGIERTLRQLEPR
jgi:hypothetical protein